MVMMMMALLKLSRRWAAIISLWRTSRIVSLRRRRVALLEGGSSRRAISRPTISRTAAIPSTVTRYCAIEWHATTELICHPRPAALLSVLPAGIALSIALVGILVRLVFGHAFGLMAIHPIHALRLHELVDFSGCDGSEDLLLLKDSVR